MKKPNLFGGPFLPEENKGEKDLTYYRERALDRSNINLQFLIEKRFTWMNDYIKEDMHGVEIGAGIGVTRDYIKTNNIELTDCYYHPWIDRVVDAMKLPYEDNSIDFLILSNVIHHVASPVLFFEAANRVLRKKGFILINDVKCSLVVRILFRILNHEGYSYDLDIFDRALLVNKPDLPWSANNAVCDLLFSDQERFQKETGLKIIEDKPVEFFVFLLSGGISSEFKTIKLNRKILIILDKIDSILSRLSSIFPLSRQTVIVKE